MARLSLCALLLLAGLTTAQELPTHDSLRAAIAIEELEHDVDGAIARYSALADDQTLTDAVRRHAALRLGRLLRARGEVASARAALERAAGGDDAVAKAAREALDGVGSDARDVELAKRAEAAVAQMTGETRGPGSGTATVTVEDLAWFGDHAVPAIRRGLGREDLLDATRRSLCDVLCRSATPGMLALFEEALAGPHGAFAALSIAQLPVQPKQPELVTAMLSRVLATAPDSVAGPLVVGLRDTRLIDPTTFVMLLTGDREATRLAAIERALSYFDRQKDQELAEQLTTALPSLLQRKSRREVEAALSLLGMLAPWTGGARGLWLSNISTAGGRLLLDSRLPNPRPTPTPNENLGAFRDALEVVGPVLGSWRQEQHGLLWILDDYLSRGAWEREALEVVLRAMELGYWCQQTPTWLEQHATTADVGRIVTALATSPGSIAELAPILLRSGLTAAHLQPLVDRLHRSALDAADEDTLRCEVLCAAVGVESSIQRLHELYSASVERDLNRAARHCRFLVTIGFASDHAVTTQVLHAALDSKYLFGSRAAKGMLVATLIRRGDGRILERLDALPTSVLTERFSLDDLGDHSQPNMTALDALVLTIRREDRLAWWHGYSDAELPGIWTRLLAGKDGEWRTWQSHLRLPYLAIDRPATPARVALQAVVIDALIARCAQDSSGWHHGDIGSTLAVGVAGSAVDAGIRSKLDDLVHAALRARSAWIVQHTVGQLGDHGDRFRRSLLVAAAHEDPETAQSAVEKLAESGPLSVEECMGLATSSLGDVGRKTAFAALAELRAGFDVRYVPVLDHPDPAVRAAVVNFFASTMDLAVVPHLLERLRDPATEVRDASSAALGAIRLYHEEKQRWAALQRGVVPLDATAAAAALLAQAGEKNDSAQRVLAITSLGVLGAPEVLPNLIGWLRDPDPAVQTAVRAAITEIHQRKR
ncbi:MAG: HEAT repeat domain-containing protein [Planctomycetota bacterium]